MRNNPYIIHALVVGAFLSFLIAYYLNVKDSEP